MAELRTELSRDLGLFTITMVGVGAMIGAGIFVLTGEAAGVAGPALVLSFALNGIVTLFTAMVYAELGSAIPEAGGGYLWIKEGLPGANAFLAGWMSWFAHAVAGALYALGFGAFIFELFRIWNVPWDAVGMDLILAKKIFGVAIVLAFAYINYRGASETGLAGNIVTVAKLGVIALFCFFGLKFMFFPEAVFTAGEGGGMGLDQLQPLIPDETGWLGILSAMGLTFIAFEGYEIIVQAGEEVVEPRKNIPKAVFWSLAIVVPIYMLVAFVLVGASKAAPLLEALRATGTEIPEGLTAQAENWEILRHVGELGLAQSAAQFIPFGAVLILIGGVLSTMSALNATTFSSTRVSFAMGRDRNLPDAFGNVHDKTRTPHVALAATAVLIVLMVAFVPITTVAAAADIMFLLLFLQVNVAVITLRKKYGDKLAYGYLIPFFPIVPIIGIVTKLLLALFMFDHYPIAWVYVLAWMVVGFGLFHFYAKDRERPEEEVPVVLEEAPIEVKEGAVLVAVAEPESAAELVRVGSRLAQARESELMLLHVVSVPRQLPLRRTLSYVREGREILDDARDLVEVEGVSIRSLIRVAHRPAEAIVRTAEDYEVEYLLMGWHGPQWGRKPLIGSNIDRVIKDSNCHALVFEHARLEATEGRPQNVLIALTDPHLAAPALEAASALVDIGGGRITLLHLSEEALDDEQKQELRDRIVQSVMEEEEEREAEEALELFGERSPVRLEFRTVERSVDADVVEVSRDYDRVVLGTGGDGGLLRRKVISDTSRKIAERADCPVVLVRPKQPAVTFQVQSFFQFFQELEEQGEPIEKPADEEDEEKES